MAMRRPGCTALPFAAEISVIIDPATVAQTPSGRDQPPLHGGHGRGVGRYQRAGADRHHGHLLQTVRWSISEGAAIEAIGEGRGVLRFTKSLVMAMLPG